MRVEVNYDICTHFLVLFFFCLSYYNLIFKETPETICFSILQK